MNNWKKLVAALGAVCAVGSAQALNVGGVVWDPNSIFDFSTTDSMIETKLNNPPAIGDSIRGYAIINNLNGTSQSTFCPGCEITYVFSGYTVTNVNPITGALTFDGGSISIYVDSTPNYNSTLQSTAADGTLFLQLSGALHLDAATGLFGTLHSDPTPASTGVAGDGRGFLNVVGGLAASYFDTNTFPIITPGGAGTADFQFTSSFQLLPGGATFVSDDGVRYGLFGSNDLQGATAVPEPATLSILSLGLLALGFSRRRWGG